METPKDQRLPHLCCDQLDFEQRFLHVRRLKHGVPSPHPLTATEIRALRLLKSQAPDAAYVFLSERKGPLTDVSVRCAPAFGSR